MTGDTDSSDFPGVVLSDAGVKSKDVFVTKFAPSGAALTFSLLVGGGADDIGAEPAWEPGGLTRLGLGEDVKFNSPAQLQQADAFLKAGVTRASSLLKMKAFEGRSLLDLVATGQLVSEHTQTLIAEAQAMDAAYSRSGLAKSKATPSDDWRAELSIPGSSE